MSLSTLWRSTWWRTKTFVDPFNSGPRNPDTMCVSGRLVIKNLTLGICGIKCPSARRMLDSWSSCLHSSRAPITTTVEISADWSGSTKSFCIWSGSDSCVMSRLSWMRERSEDLKSGYFCASWNTRVGKMSSPGHCVPQHPLSRRMMPLDARQRRPVRQLFVRWLISPSQRAR